MVFFKIKVNSCILIHPSNNFFLGESFLKPYFTYIGMWVETINSTLDTLVQ